MASSAAHRLRCVLENSISIFTGNIHRFTGSRATRARRLQHLAKIFLRLEKRVFEAARDSSIEAFPPWRNPSTVEQEDVR